MQILAVKISRRRVLAGIAVCLFPVGSRSWADAPPVEPERRRIYSGSRRYFAEIDPDTRKTTVFEVRGKRAATERWSMPVSPSVVFLANDGEHLVIGHEGGNLLPLDHRADEPVITFVCHAQVIRTVPLNELVTDPAVLQKTASHVWWGDYVGFDKRGAFLVQTADKRRWSFDVATGRGTAQKAPQK